MQKKAEHQKLATANMAYA